MNWSELKSKDVDDKVFKDACNELAGSSLAIKKAVEQDLSFEGILNEITRMKNLMGVIQSHCSIKVLSNIVKK